MILLQILLVVIVCKICGWLAKKIGQPQVVGEMIAGILLGKSVFAQIWPDGFEFVFPESSMAVLAMLSKIGLGIFMFSVGLDLKAENLKNRITAAVAISQSSIVFPFLLGFLVSIPLFDHYAPENVSFLSFASFMGISMSITAFPVLARILQERNLTKTPLGSLAIACAAVDDITAWCLLAIIAGISKLQSLVLILPLLAGFLVPKSFLFRNKVFEQIQKISAIVLLPLFFTYTGIRLQVSTLTSSTDWLVCFGLILLAILGKMLGGAIAARWVGTSWRESWVLGTLMNTRGLMELVVLNIGLDLGILSPEIFAMMVIMAIVTTMMTGPLLTVLLPKPQTSV